MVDNVNGQRHVRSALILYGSETGNSQDVAEDLGSMAERLHFVTRVSEMDLLEINVLLEYTVVIFVISTTGQGEFPRNARKFWKSLLRKRLPPDCLGHVSFTTFGLGDSSYPKYNWTARKLHKRLEQLGAKEVCPRGEADEQHEEGIDGSLLSWKNDLRKHLIRIYPLPEGKSPIPQDVPLVPKFFLRLIESGPDASNSQLKDVNYQAEPSNLIAAVVYESHMFTLSPPSSRSVLLEHETQEVSTNTQKLVSTDTIANMALPEFSPETGDSPREGPFVEQLKDTPPARVIEQLDQNLPPSAHLPIPGTCEVTLIKNQRVTPSDHWQDVRELTFYASKNETFKPGDVMVIYPKNFPHDVQALIDLMGWNEVADWPLEIIPRREYPIEGLSYIPSGLHTIHGGSLRDLITHNLDITAVPKRTFLEKMALYTDDEVHKERLKELIDPVYADELYDYTTRPRRSILEVLVDFPSVKLPWGDAASIFPIIRGRQFSITSGGALKDCQYGDFQTVQLLVAIVKYRTVIKKIRQGICTRYLASLTEQTSLSVTFSSYSKFFLPNSLLKPIVMIAPGTGIAPCRSIIWERAQLTQRLYASMPTQLAGHAAQVMGENYLFFGGRNERADYFYKNEWQLDYLNTWVFTAFSRDQKKKIYVQDIIREQKKLLHDLIMEDTATIYVCGSAGAMPKAVKEALVDVLLENEDMEGDREKAVEYLDRLEKTSRYIQETW